MSQIHVQPCLQYARVWKVERVIKVAVVLPCKLKIQLGAPYILGMSIVQL